MRRLASSERDWPELARVDTWQRKLIANIRERLIDDIRTLDRPSSQQARLKSYAFPLTGCTNCLGTWNVRTSNLLDLAATSNSVVEWIVWSHLNSIDLVWSQLTSSDLIWSYEIIWCHVSLLIHSVGIAVGKYTSRTFLWRKKKGLAGSLGDRG